MAARNEEANLELLLPALRNLDYGDFEVIIVDDGSTDGTARVVESHARSDSRVSLVTVQPREPRKKNAITAGIARAKNEIIALTDADCLPDRGWLRSIASHYAGDYENRLIIGYGPYRREDGLVNKVARYENLTTSYLTAAACGLHRPYMGVGRNMSYPRTLFNRVGGLGATMQSLSGDDDLFVQHAIRKGAEAVHMFGEAGAVVSPAPSSWGSWFRQKHRHASAGRYYERTVKLHLSLFHASGIALWFAPVFMGWLGIAYLMARLGLQHVMLRRAAGVFGAKDLLRTHPLWEMSYSLYNLLVAPLGLLIRPASWYTGSER